MRQLKFIFLKRGRGRDREENFEKKAALRRRGTRVDRQILLNRRLLLSVDDVHDQFAISRPLDLRSATAMHEIVYVAVGPDSDKYLWSMK